MRIIDSKQFLVSSYKQLLNMTSDENEIMQLRRILMNETSHTDTLIDMYSGRFGEQPVLANSNAPQANSYISAIKELITSELDLNILCTNIIFSESNVDVRNAFSLILADDNRHASRLNLIYTRYLEMKLM